MTLILTPEDEGEVHRLICLAFVGESAQLELNEFVKKALQFDIFVKLGGRNMPIEQFATALMEEVSQAGTAAALLEGLLVHRKGDSELRGLVKRLLPEALALVPDAVHNEERVKLTQIGIENLSALAHDPAVAKLIADARLDLQRVSQDLKLLASYKELHDVLHRVQVRLFKPMGKALKEFPADPLAGLELGDYVNTLAEQASEAERVIAGFPDEKKAQNEAAWSKTLTGTAAKLAIAIRDADQAAARMALTGLKVLLRSQPPQLNALLVQTARDIPIERLVEVLRAVAGKFDDPAERKRLEDAAAALDSIACEVRGRLAEHQAWQTVETSFWLTEEAILREPPDVDELNVLWPAMTEKLAEIGQLAPGPWAAELNNHAAAFTNVCPMPATPPVDPNARRAMDLYVTRGRVQFYLVDKALKERCLNVAKLSQPLNTLVAND